MTALRYILFFYSLVSIFISGGLFFQKKGRPHIMLALFTLLFGIEILDFLYSTSRFLNIFPDFYGVYYFLVGFIYGPILWFHFQSVIYTDKRYSFLTLIHFVPFVLALIYYADILALPGNDKIWYAKIHFYDRLMPLNYARAGHLLLYGIWFIVLVCQNKNLLTAKSRLYAMAVCSIYFVTAVIISWLTLFADNWRQFILYYFTASTIVFMVGYVLYATPDFLDGIAQKYIRSGLDQLTMDRIVRKIEMEFQKNKAYLNRDLTLNKLSGQINEKPHFISQSLSEQIGENFNDFVNRHRIEHAKQMLSNIQLNHFKIEAIANESGFNNKATFNKAFLKFVAITPSGYKALVQNRS